MRRRALAVTALAALVVLAGGAAAGRSFDLRLADFTHITQLGPFGVDGSGNPIANGRVGDVAVDPFDSTHYLALADSGLWESNDTAQTWHRLPGLEQYGQWAVGYGSIAFDPDVQGTVVIASPGDNQTFTRRGVYLSTDGGATWTQPPGYRPICSPATPTSIAYSAHTFYVAGDCAAGTGASDGASWTWDYYPDAYSSLTGITVDTAGTVYACGRTGIYRHLPSAGSPWDKVVNFQDPGWALGASSGCRITASPDQPDHVFVAAQWDKECLPSDATNCGWSEIIEAYRDAGQMWHTQNLMGGYFQNGRPVLAETTPVNGSTFYLYWSSDANDSYEPCTTGTGFECPQGTAEVANSGGAPWVGLGHGDPPGLHADTSRILFQHSAPYCIDLISDDGGIEHPQQGNCRGDQAAWTFSNSGLAALEAYNIALGVSPGGGDDVYAADQDVGGTYLADGATGWSNDNGQVNRDGLEVAVTGGTSQKVATVLNTGTEYYGRGFSAPGTTSGSLFTTAYSWGDPFSLAMAPFGPDGFIALSHQAHADQTGVFTSSDGGATFVLRDALPDNPVIGREQRPWVLTEQADHSTLVAYVVVTGRLEKLWFHPPSGVPFRVQEVGFRNFGPIGAADDRHLIAFACEGEVPCAGPDVVTSDDGGVRWAPLPEWPALSVFFTHDGYRNGYPLDSGGPNDGEVTSVARDPSNPNVLIIGTRDCGLFGSGDGGVTWSRFAIVAPNFYDLAFDTAGNFFADSFGRGVFKIHPSFDRLQVSPHIARGAAHAVLVSFRATATAPTHAPEPGLSVDFSVLDGDGNQVGHAVGVTDAKGVSRVTLNETPQPGSYRVLVEATDPKSGATTATAAKLVVKKS
jgi:hypothetical protein